MAGKHRPKKNPPPPPDNKVNVNPDTINDRYELDANGQPVLKKNG